MLNFIYNIIKDISNWLKKRCKKVDDYDIGDPIRVDFNFPQTISDQFGEEWEPVWSKLEEVETRITQGTHQYVYKIDHKNQTKKPYQLRGGLILLKRKK